MLQISNGHQRGEHSEGGSLEDSPSSRTFHVKEGLAEILLRGMQALHVLGSERAARKVSDAIDSNVKSFCAVRFSDLMGNENVTSESTFSCALILAHLCVTFAACAFNEFFIPARHAFRMPQIHRTDVDSSYAS